MTDQSEDVPNHTVRLLQELRQYLDRRFDVIEREIAGLHTGVAEVNRRLDATHDVIVNESARHAFAFRGVEERFQSNERRIQAIENARTR